MEISVVVGSRSAPKLEALSGVPWPFNARVSAKAARRGFQQVTEKSVNLCGVSWQHDDVAEAHTSEFCTCAESNKHCAVFR